MTPDGRASCLAMPSDAPVLVEVTRGDMVESQHRGAVAVVDALGATRFALGDVERLVYPRSAIKPLQAIPLIETGAAAARGVSEAELALACASHGGTPDHVAAVEAWLGRLGLAPDDLMCGAHMPNHRESAWALTRSGQPPTALHNNCSGKHAAMLTTAVHNGDHLDGYVEAEHPVQQRILGVPCDLCGVDIDAAPRGIDGCGIPVVGIPLRALALGMARFADPSALPTGRRDAIARILAAMAQFPTLVAWPGHFVTEVLTATAGDVIVKNGAEGVYCAAVPDLGRGVALKIADGAARAAEVAMGAVLQRIGALKRTQIAALSARLTVGLRNCAGTPVGEIRPASPLRN